MRLVACHTTRIKIHYKVLFFPEIFKHRIFLMLEKQYSATARFSGRVNTAEFAAALNENLTSDGNYRTEARHEGIDLCASLRIGSGKNAKNPRADGLARTLAFRLCEWPDRTCCAEIRDLGSCQCCVLILSEPVLHSHT